MSPIIISVEGNIGAGKSTFLEKWKTTSKRFVLSIPEPVEEWRKSGMLNYFYSDPVKNGLVFQLYVLNSRFSTLLSTYSEWDKYDIVLVERSFESDDIFAQISLNKKEYDIYKKFSNTLQETINSVTAHYERKTVYLDTRHFTCKQRIIQRSRTEEDGIPLEYLEKIQQHHDARFKHAYKYDNGFLEFPSELNLRVGVPCEYENVFEKLETLFLTKTPFSDLKVIA